MLRPLSVIVVAALVVSACASTAPTSSSVTRATAAATVSTVPAPSLTTAPSLTAAPVPSAPTETTSPDPVSGMETDPSSPPLEVDWSRAPAFPSPLLSAAGARLVKPAGSVGCQIVYYEPSDDPYGRVAAENLPCRPDQVSLVAPITVPASSSLVLTAAKSWLLGAQYIPDTAPYGPFVSVRALSIAGATAGINSVPMAPGIDLASEEGFALSEISATAPSAAGDYLLLLDAQSRKPGGAWRSMGLAYLWWLRVVP